MSLTQQLTDDMKAALKAKDADSLTTIRYLLSQIKNAQIDGAGDDDASIQKIIAAQVKKSQDAITDFVKAGRQDLVDIEQQKISQMKKYLPAQLDDAQLEQIIQQLKQELGSNIDTGRLIGQVMKKVGTQADGHRVKELVTKLASQS